MFFLYCMYVIGCMHACDMLSVYVILCKYKNVSVNKYLCTDVMSRLYEKKDIFIASSVRYLCYKG